MNIVARLRALAREYVPPPLKPHLRHLAVGARQRFRNARYLSRRIRARSKNSQLYRHIGKTLQAAPIGPEFRELLRRLVLDRPVSRESWAEESDGEYSDVLYVTNRLSPDALKDILALHGTGRLKCTVLCGFELENAEPLLEAGISVVSYPSPFRLVRRLVTTRAAVTIARRGSSVECALARLFGPGRFVYRPYDFVEGNPAGPVEVSARKVATQAEAERFLLRAADGLIHIHEDPAIRSVRSNYGFRGLDVRIRPGCAPAFAADRHHDPAAPTMGGLHLVQARIFGRGRTDPRPGLPGPPAAEVEGFLRQGIHFHMYYANHGDPPRDVHLREHLELAARFPNYHIHPAPAYRDLVRELTRYDAAFSYFPKRRAHRVEKSWGPLLTSFYAYLDAGLPVVTAPDNWPMADLVRDHQIGLVLHPADVDRAAEILRTANLPQLRENVRRARPLLQHDSEALATFIRRLGGIAENGAGFAPGQALRQSAREPLTIPVFPSGNLSAQ